MIYYLNSDLILSVIFKFHRVVHSQFWQLSRKKSGFFFGKPTAFKLKNIILSGPYLPNTKFVTLPPCRSQGCLKGCLTGFSGRRCRSRRDTMSAANRRDLPHSRSSPIATRLMVTCTPTYITTTKSTSNT